MARVRSRSGCVVFDDRGFQGDTVGRGVIRSRNHIAGLRRTRAVAGVKVCQGHRKGLDYDGLRVTRDRPLQAPSIMRHLLVFVLEEREVAAWISNRARQKRSDLCAPYVSWAAGRR